MSTHLPRMRRALTPLMAFGLATLILAGSAQATNKTGADVRVVTANGKTLVDQRQYTGTAKVPTSKKADCFGEGTGGSGDEVEVPGATALGVVADASAHTPKLRPLLLSDYFDFGIGICGFGGVVAPQTGYWYLKLNHAATTTGGDQTPIDKGDDVLWYLINDYDDPIPAELEIEAPLAVDPGAKIPVRVFEYADDGTRAPAAGATIAGTGVVTGPDGRAEVEPQGGTTRLQAVRTGDIPSRQVGVCAGSEVTDCPDVGDLFVVGTGAKDKIKADRRLSAIHSHGGSDTIDVRRAKDSLPPLVKCGTGKDTIVIRRKQEYTARGCERVKRD